MRDLKKYQEDYYNLPFEQLQVYFRRKKVLEFLEKHNHSNVCEIGCGLEPLFKYFKTYQKMHVVEPILEFYQNACAEAKNKNNITIHLGKLEENIDILIQENFDCVVLSGLLHEVNNSEELLKCIHQISSSQTFIHINVPNARSFHRVMAHEMGLIDNIYNHSNNQQKLQQSETFDLKSLENFVIKNGFYLLESGSYFVKPFTHQQMHKMYENGIINMEILNGLYLMVKYMPEMGSEIYVNVKPNK